MIVFSNKVLKRVGNWTVLTTYYDCTKYNSTNSFSPLVVVCPSEHMWFTERNFNIYIIFSTLMTWTNPKKTKVPNRTYRIQLFGFVNYFDREMVLRARWNIERFKRISSAGKFDENLAIAHFVNVYRPSIVTLTSFFILSNWLWHFWLKTKKIVMKFI